LCGQKEGFIKRVNETVALQVETDDKWNPVFESRTGLPCFWGNKYSNLTLQVVGVSKLREYNMVTSPAGLKLEKDSAVDGQQ
jgi:hypothetical protein